MEFHVYIAYIALALGGGGLLCGLWQTLRSRRTLRRLDQMLNTAIDGGFTEDCFDESTLSSLESKMARFLNGCAASTRNLAEEKDAIKTLIADISHQTKIPVSNILLYASLLAEGDLPPEQAGQAAALFRQAEKLSFLIQALVKASRLESGILTMEPSVHGLLPLLESTAEQAAAAAQAKGLELLVEPTDCTARYDAKWTAEALFNVVDNAVKYTPPGGRVQLSVTALELFCRIDVADTGIGIPETEQGGIFRRFCRGRAVQEQEGLGIGLYLTREILSGQGGYIKVSSRPGRGSTFSLYLPRG